MTKLRAILLMEADFNFSNKIVYGVRMMDNASKYGLMPEEMYSEKNKIVDNGTLAKVLFFYITRQTRLSAGLSSVDAANCYDAVAHVIASLTFQAFGVPEEAVQSMLSAIEEMKYFLRTAYGDSKNFRGSKLEFKFQGLYQGNGAAPAGRAVVSITILGAHKRKGHEAHFICPISRRTGHLLAISFVDDTDLIHVDMSKTQSALEAHVDLQESVDNWGRLLIASGGSLKPEKCFFYLISFGWKADGQWSYQSNVNKKDFALGVPMPGGDVTEIEHLKVDVAKEMLGVKVCPTGAAVVQFLSMKKKAQQWIDRARESKLQRRDIWFLVDRQLWPKLGYGLCSVIALWKDLVQVFKKTWWQLILLSGVIRSAPRDLRQLSRGFYGIGCPHPGVECFVQQINKLQAHYGCKPNLGLKLNVLLDLLIVELGTSSQPFRESFKKYGKQATWSWLASLWEKCDKFKVAVELNVLSLRLPREGDMWIMKLFEQKGFGAADLARLNKVKLHQQVLFLSCVLGATGKLLDMKYMSKTKDDEDWSTINFPQERP